MMGFRHLREHEMAKLVNFDMFITFIFVKFSILIEPH